jgi:hypothetical protein
VEKILSQIKYKIDITLTTSTLLKKMIAENSTLLKETIETMNNYIAKNAQIFSTFGAIFLVLFMLLKRKVHSSHSVSTWLPTLDNISKRQFEIFSLRYTAVWIGCFMVVLATQAYESFTENEYMYLCVGLSLPFLLQPFLYPLQGEKCLPFWMRYSFKANVWIAIFSFIGNYWYTHYFYSVLKASYSFPSHRLNDVPIALYFATHFYFVTYHTFSNMILRKIETTYDPSMFRTGFFWGAVLAFSYFTGISSFYEMPLSYTSIDSPPPTFSLVLLFRTPTRFFD